MATETTPMFRFVNVRPPIKASRTTVSRGFVSLSETNSAFIVSLLGIKEDTTTTQSAKMTLLKETAREFLGSENAFVNIQALYDAIGATKMDFAQSLAAKKTTLTSADIPENASTTYRITATQKTKLWDTLIASMIVNTQPEFKEALTQLLQMQHFWDTLPQLGEASDVHIRRLIASPLILPPKLFPLPRPEIAPISAPLAPHTNTERSELMAEMERIETAKTVLVNLTRKYLKALKKGGETEPPLEVITSEDWAACTPEVKATFALYGVEEGDFLSDSIETLTQAAAQKYAGIWKGVNPTRKVVVTKSGIFAQNQTERMVRNEGEANDAMPEYMQQRTNYGESDPYENFFAENRPQQRCLSVGDYIKVEQTLCCYEPGEVADIKNIMQGEFMKHSTRRLKRREDSIEIETLQEEEKEKDTTSADRFEMQKETENTMNMDASLSVGASVSATYGTVNANVNTQFSSSYAQSQSEHNAVNYARDLTERTLNRIHKKVQEVRKTRTVEELEVFTDHEYDNRGSTGAGDKHIVGLYRWVNKVYNAQLVNYGKRVMMEFMIPEPAAFHLWAMTQRNNPADSLTLEEPIHPSDMVLSVPLLQNPNTTNYNQISLPNASALNESNYLHWAAFYGASVEAPPQTKKVVVGMVEDVGKDPEKYAARLKTDFTVEDGYMATYVHYRGKAKAEHVPEVFIGHLQGWISAHDCALDNLRGKIEIVLYADKLFAVGVGFTFTLTPTPESYASWQIRTYQAILQAYERKKATYDAALSEAKSMVENGFVKGTNPAMNKKIIQDELKKGCLRWLFNNGNAGEEYNTWAVWYYSPDNDWTSENNTPGASVGIPQMTRDALAIELNEKIKFAENAFEWDIMSYQLMPYFYGATMRWRKLYNLTDDDPLMQSFMQAGMAKVILPVRPGFEEAAMHLLANGYSPMLAAGGTLPAIDSDIYTSIMEEVWQARQQVVAQTPTLVGQPFKFTVPSSLVVLQCNSGCVEGTGLPCNCEGHEAVGANNGQIMSGIGNNTPPTA